MSQYQVARRSRTLSILVVVAMLTLLLGSAAQASLDRSGRASPAAVVAHLAVAPQVTNLQSTGAAGGRVVLTWDNPSPLSFDAIEIRYQTGGYPATINDGIDPDPPNDPGREDLGIEDVHWTVRGLTNQTTYFFSVFTSDDGGTTWSPPAQTERAPYVCPKVTSAISAPAGLITEKVWAACSAPHAIGQANTLNTLPDLVGDLPFFPRVGTEQALLTTGERDFAALPALDDQGVDRGTGYNDAFDVSMLRLSLTIPAAANCVRFDYVMATEGDPSAGVEQDAFLVHKGNHADWEVDGSTLDDGSNQAALSNGQPASIGSALFGPGADVYPTGVNGSGYDLMTGPLNVSVPVDPGTTPRLFLSLFDRGSGAGPDSAVFVDRFRTSTETCQPGTNRWPTASPDTATFSGNQGTINVIANDDDPDTVDVLSAAAAVVRPPAHGDVTCNGASCTYTRDAGYVGTDSFVYRVLDGSGGFDTARVSLTLEEPDRPAVTVNASPMTLGLGDLVRITGRSIPADADTKVRLQKFGAGVWKTVQERTVATTPVTGAFVFTVRPPSGLATYRVFVPAQDGRMGAASAAKTLRVYDAAITRVTKTAKEVVTIKNTGKVTVNTKGWKLRNRAGDTVTLPKRLVKPGATLRIHFQRGTSDANDVYLRHRPMFGNRHDIAKLVDSSGFLVHQLRY